MEAAIPTTEAASSSRRIESVLLAVVLLTYGYFQMPAAWNENSRYDLTRSIVEHGALDIDRFHGNTGDKSLHEGRYYSDKAPGAALLAVPAYAVYHAALVVTGSPRPRQLDGPGDTAPA